VGGVRSLGVWPHGRKLGHWGVAKWEELGR
jgi:hypothetical protein